MSLQHQLATGVATLGCGLEPAQQDQLLAYIALLEKWNKAFNLTAVRDPAEMVTRHVLDSLAVLPFLSDQSTLDVGTGPGIPGIILAIARPDQHFTLLDSNGKKTRFVRQARRELGLDNVEVVHGRVEQYRTQPGQIICRAFASLTDMLSLMAPVIGPVTRVLAMKAATTEAEMATLTRQWRGICHVLNVPGLDEPRTLVELCKLDEG